MKNFKKAFLKSIKTYLLCTCIGLAFCFLMFGVISFINLLADFGLFNLFKYAVAFLVGAVFISAFSAILISKSEDLQ